MRDHFLLRCLCIALITFAISACSDDDDDDDSANNGPTADGSELPSGGTTDSPVGKYVAEVTDVTLPTDTTDWDVFVGDSPAFVIDQDLSLKIVGLDDQGSLEALALATLAYDAENDWWRGTQRVTDPEDDSITEETYTVSRNGDAWQLTNGDKIDSDGDGNWDDSSAITATLHPRLDWSGRAGNWHGGHLLVDSDTGMLYANVVPAQFTAEGAGMGGGALFYFYDDDGTLRSQIHDPTYDEVLTFTITKDQNDLMVISFESRKVPASVTGAAPSAFPDSDTGEIHFVPASRLASFAQTVDLTVASQSEEDVNGDGEGFFEQDLVGSTVTVTLESDGSHEVALGDTTLEQGSYAYLDLAGGVLMCVKYENYGSSNGYGVSTLVVDGAGDATGDGRRDGYDFPDHDQDGEIDDDEFLGMEATGVVIFGNGVATDELPYVGLEDLLMTALSGIN
ncbi:MAG: hypothetical protein ACOCZK_04515 [Planctomycetota bacterium]